MWARRPSFRALAARTLLTVGVAHILHQLFGGEGMMAFWYHFAILFEALFILTAVDASTRADRFMLQDLLGTFVPVDGARRFTARQRDLDLPCVAAWGFFLPGVVDPLGGIITSVALFGIANQMLAALALTLGTDGAVPDEEGSLRLGHCRCPLSGCWLVR